MPRKTFARELEAMEERLIALGDVVEKTLVESVDILKRRDQCAARRLIAADSGINAQRYAIESDCLALIAMQQPMAGDLRVIAAILEIATELERVADYAKGIANITLLLGDKPLVKPLVDIPKMAQKASQMLHRSLDAFMRRDVALALAICAEDDEVDELYIKVYKELVSCIIADPQPAVIEGANHLLWAAHNLERTGDRVTNVCERVIFTVTGELGEICDNLEPGITSAAQ